MTTTLRLFWAALREIFDEAAYERFLQRTGEPRSRESFAAFLEASKAGRERKVRCC
ncbi:MAG TPA: hypothetical protein VN577_02340 [Terriglobales bacterium]|nr:hypothetical protein [Terriglobales bacterium]